MRFFPLFLGLVFGAGLLGASCSFSELPGPLPTGYTHHNKPYKSPDPRPSEKFTEIDRRSMGPQQEIQWRDAAYDLLARLTARAGLPPKPVHVKSADPMTPFYSHLDNNLREAMRETGYKLVPQPEGAYVFTYSAVVLPEEEQSADGNLRLTLHVYDSKPDKSELLTEETAVYHIEGGKYFRFLPAETWHGSDHPGDDGSGNRSGRAGSYERHE